MSDRNIPITLTGSYKGFQVSIQVDSTLDNLDRLVERLQARGVEPLAAPSKGSKDGQHATVAGTVREIRPSKETVFAIDLDTGDGGAPLRCVAFGSMAHIAGNRLFVGTCCELSGKYREHESYGTSLVISGIVSADKAAA